MLLNSLFKMCADISVWKVGKRLENRWFYYILFLLICFNYPSFLELKIRLSRTIKTEKKHLTLQVWQNFAHNFAENKVPQQRTD